MKIEGNVMQLLLTRYLMIVSLFCMMQIPLYAIEYKNDKDVYIAISEELSAMREMIELYVAIGGGLRYQDPRKRLKSIISKSDTLIKAILQKYQNTEILESANGFVEAWREIKEHIESALVLKNTEMMKGEILYIHANLFKLKKALLHIKKTLQPQMNMLTKKSLMGSTIIGSAARTLSAHYYMEMWELDDPTISNHWKKAIQKYETSLSILEKSSFSKDDRFHKLLIGTKKDLLFFKVLWELKEGTHAPALISRKSKHAYRNAIEMEKIILSTLSD
jgi:hypothetical protein